TENSDTPNILFIVFDTLSAQHVSLFGYQRETTPNFARFAERATVFHNHRTTANFTSPATSSIFTGTYPWTHRAFHLHGTIDHTFAERNMFNLLPDSYYKAAYTHNLLVTSLLHQFGGELDMFKQTRDLCLTDGEFADLLFNNDYSAAFWGESTALRTGATPPGTIFLSMLERMRRFATKSAIDEQYAALYPRGIPNLHNLFFLLEDAIDWIGEQVTTLPQPFLGYFHLLPPHEPYTTRRDFVDIFKDDWHPIEKEPHFSSEGLKQGFLNQQRREYDEYLAFTDAEFGRLLDKLEADGILDNSYVILTSDHGELFERGIRGHVTMTLFEGLLHVPLLISKPGQQNREDVFAHTSSVDVLPTLLHLTGQPIPDWCEGQVLPSFGVDVVENGRSIYGMEAKSNPKQAPLTKATLALVKDQFKLIHYFGYRPDDPEGTYELFDLENDPEELENLINSGHPAEAALKAEMAEKLAEVNRPFQR
ncbi:MAG: sulfatase, partial [Anaerolineales bacterium]|nr:sulfatase [Anaerolineales bacterium]